MSDDGNTPQHEDLDASREQGLIDDLSAILGIDDSYTTVGQERDHDPLASVFEDSALNETNVAISGPGDRTFLQFLDTERVSTEDFVREAIHRLSDPASRLSITNPSLSSLSLIHI
jgi:hypothetical protein